AAMRFVAEGACNEPDKQSRVLGAGWRRNLRLAQLLTRETLSLDYNVDFRGRIYPSSETLSPQGSDLRRALLTFAEGRPMGPHGARALANHGAVLFGNGAVTWLDAESDQGWLWA